MFGSLLKAVVGAVVETPIAMAADVVTMCGVATGKNESYTVKAVKRVMENVEDAVNPEAD